ncbi:MAG: OmpA family protein [Sinimarinibacterium flocculans]|uniref:OmpA family protein n=1 Tax=Sinimarinibacterium flocculans TaxID=985250 RepID=UPI003C56DF1A
MSKKSWWYASAAARAAWCLSAVAGLCSAAASAQTPDAGWYFGIKGYASSLSDSDGETVVPGDPGSPGSPSESCLLGDLLGLGSLLSPEGCLIGLIGGGNPGTDPTAPTAGQRLRTSISYDTGWATEVTLGYRTESGLRPELSLAYGENDWDEITLTTSGGVGTTVRSSSQLETLRAMANLWQDFDLGRAQPYLGGGIGFQRSSIAGDQSADDSGIGWQLGAGVGFTLSPRTVLSVDYRFAGADDPEYRTDDGGTLSTEYQAHKVALGLRYTFAPAEKPAPPPAKQPATVPYEAPVKTPTILCPDTPAGIPVGPDNCPLDSDGDGIPDYLDQCPNTPPGLKVLPDGCAPQGDCRKPRPGERVDERGCALEGRFILRGVNFEFDSDRLTPEARLILNDVAGTLKAYPSVNVDVEGHTDWIGTEAYNLGLSERRANAVKRYLVDQGVPAGRMHPVGYGESQPVADNETEDGRGENRRVELKVND